MNIGSVVDFPERKQYCVLSIDVICRDRLYYSFTWFHRVVR